MDDLSFKTIVAFVIEAQQALGIYYLIINTLLFASPVCL